MAICVSGPTTSAQSVSDNIMVLQDENFFLQDEIRKLQAELVDKDNALKKLLLDKELARAERGEMLQQKDVLESKVGALQKMLLGRDLEFSSKAEEAAAPYRARMEAAQNELKAMTMALEQKAAHEKELLKEKDALMQKMDLLTGEKISLLKSLRKIAAERDELKDGMEGAITGARQEAEAKVRDFQVRLAAEQTLTMEKVAQARKPLEDRLTSLEVQCRSKEEALRQGAAAEVKRVQDLLNVCRAAPEGVQKAVPAP